MPIRTPHLTMMMPQLQMKMWCQSRKMTMAHCQPLSMKTMMSKSVEQALCWTAVAASQEPLWR